MGRGAACTLAKLLWAFVYLLALCACCVESTVTTATRDYCQWESFNVTCPPGHVMLVTGARYGRMRMGRCLATDIFVGCSADVTDELNGRCGGRGQCVIDVPDSVLHDMQPCPRDMMAYMEASYECIAVATAAVGSVTSCQAGRALPVSQPSGYVSPAVAVTNGWGARDCPWLVKVKAGQKIRLTLINLASFTPGRWRLSSDVTADATLGGGLGAGSRSRSRCVPYVMANDGGTGSRQQWLYCANAEGGSDRKSSLVTSSDRVELTLSTEQGINFLLHYEPVGCEDLQVPPGAHGERKGETLTVTCNGTGQVWHLVCRDTTWVGTVSHNCTLSTQQLTRSELEGAMPTYGLVLAVVTGIIVGMTCGSITLMIILWAQRRKVKGVTSAADPCDVMLPPDGCSDDDVTRRIYAGPRSSATLTLTAGETLYRSFCTSSDVTRLGRGDLFHIVDASGQPVGLYRSGCGAGGDGSICEGCRDAERKASLASPLHRQRSLTARQGQQQQQQQQHVHWKTGTMPAAGSEWENTYGRSSSINSTKGSRSSKVTMDKDSLLQSPVLSGLQGQGRRSSLSNNNNCVSVGSSSSSNDRLGLHHTALATPSPRPTHRDDHQLIHIHEQLYQRPGKVSPVTTTPTAALCATEGLDLLDCTILGGGQCSSSSSSNNSSNSSNVAHVNFTDSIAGFSAPSLTTFRAGQQHQQP